MLEELLAGQEGKTLEFKENTRSLQKIVQTIIAFANTAGGTIVVGIEDKTKEVVGLEDILKEEEKVANSVAASISPMIFPTLQLYTYRGKDILIITVPHSFGPYHLKGQSPEESTFIRLGSTNRIADKETLTEIRQLKEQKYFDELPNVHATLEMLDLTLAKKLFAKVKKKFTEKTAQSLGITVTYQGKLFPSNGGILLFGNEPATFFPDAHIRLARFLGTTKAEVLDHQDYQGPLINAIYPLMAFVRRNTAMAAKFGGIQREDIPEYASAVLREAITNALLHADYTIKGSSIQLAIFDDRIEITNPGALPFGLDLKTALSGVSMLRNKTIGRVFRELNIIEQWGSGFGRMITISKENGMPEPKFEELGTFFRTTLYSRTASVSKQSEKDWDEPLISHLKKKRKITAKEARQLWQVTSRTTSSRLQKMIKAGLITQIGTSPFDPQKIYVLPQK